MLFWVLCLSDWLTCPQRPALFWSISARDFWTPPKVSRNPATSSCLPPLLWTVGMNGWCISIGIALRSSFCLQTPRWTFWRFGPNFSFWSLRCWFWGISPPNLGKAYFLCPIIYFFHRGILIWFFKFRRSL